MMLDVERLDETCIQKLANEEVLAIRDYHGFYKTKLARMHLARPLPADARLWTEADIASVENSAAAPAPATVKPLRTRETRAPAKQRRTGTR